MARPFTRRPASSRVRSFAAEGAAADEDVLVRRLGAGEVDGGERLEAGGDGGADDPLDLLGQRVPVLARSDAVVGELERAGDREERCGPDRGRELPGCLQRGVRADGQDHEVGVSHGLLVRRALDAQHCGDLARAGGVARADHDALAEHRDALGKRPAEGSRAADDRDPHRSAAAASSAASASRRRASASRISVRVTIGRTAPRSTSPSASSYTSASISPL